MAGCVDCFSNCGDNRTTDRCVQYTGVDIPLLGICNGDSLYQIEVIVIEKLLEIIDGTGIDLSEVTIGCDFLNDILDGEDKNLANIVQMLVTANCTLRDLVQDIQDELATSFSVSAPCLTLPTTPTRDDILAATVTKLCSLNTAFGLVQVDYVKASELCAAVNTCLASSGTVQEYTKMPKYVAMAYTGPLSVFDSTGKGLSAFGYDKVYLCNGNNSTPDMRGRAAVGANTNIVGPALDAAVDPAVLANAGYNIAQSTKKGTYTHTLITTELAAHSHSVTDPGHTHLVANVGQYNRPCGDSCTPDYEPGGGGLTSNSSVTGITIATTGSGQPHNNTQPSFGVAWIIFLP